MKLILSLLFLLHMAYNVFLFNRYITNQETTVLNQVIESYVNCYHKNEIIRIFQILDNNWDTIKQDLTTDFICPNIFCEGILYNKAATPFKDRCILKKHDVPSNQPNFYNAFKDIVFIVKTSQRIPNNTERFTSVFVDTCREYIKTKYD